MKRPWLVFLQAFIGGIVIFFLGFSLLMSLFFLFKEDIKPGPKIGVLEVKGVIFSSDPYLGAIRELRERRDVKGVLLRIESPGGTVASCQEIYEELKALAKEKPLYVSMGEVSASGGLYISLAGEKVFANPGTITGSIGVLIQLPNFQKLMEKIGVSAEVIKSGSFKDTGSPYRGLTPEERRYLNEKVEILHNQFVRAVALARNLPLEKVKTLADGRIFTGEEALNLKLIDALGNFNKAVEELRRRLNIEKLELVYYPQKKGVWERVIEEKLPLRSLQPILDPLEFKIYYLLTY